MTLEEITKTKARLMLIDTSLTEAKKLLFDLYVYLTAQETAQKKAARQAERQSESVTSRFPTVSEFWDDGTGKPSD